VALYVDLLMEGHDMIRHGSMFITQEGTELVARQFFETQGEDAFPIPLKAGAEDDRVDEKLASLIQRSQKKPVHVPEPLYDILSQSRHAKQIAEMLESVQAHAGKEISPDKLTAEEGRIVQQILVMARQAVDSGIQGVAIWDFGDDNADKQAELKDNVLRLARQQLDTTHVHKSRNRCTSLAIKIGERSCACCVLNALITFIRLKSELRTKQPQEARAFQTMMTERLMHELLWMRFASSDQSDPA
jgi:hypothetical protein